MSPSVNSIYNFGGNREKVLARDGFQCCLCGMTNAEHLNRFGMSISVDHKDGNGRYSLVKNHAMRNLWTLCLSCHGRKDNQHRLKQFCKQGHPFTEENTAVQLEYGKWRRHCRRCWREHAKANREKEKLISEPRDG